MFGYWEDIRVAPGLWGGGGGVMCHVAEKKKREEEEGGRVHVSGAVVCE